jgi:hypothetical protein
MASTDGTIVTCLNTSERYEKQSFTMRNDQAAAIFETFDGKVPSQLTFTFPDDDDFLYNFYVAKCDIESNILDDTRYTLVQQALSSFYTIHKFLEDTGLDTDHAYLMGENQKEPYDSDAKYIDMIKCYASPELMSFMFWEPFMKFVGAHCNSNVLCIY